MKRATVHHVGSAQGRRDDPRRPGRPRRSPIYKLGQAANLFTKRYDLVALSAERERAARRRLGDRWPASWPARSRRSTSCRSTPTPRATCACVVEVDQALQQQIREDSTAQGCARSACSATRSSTSRRARRATRSLPPSDTIPVAPSLDYEAVIAQASGAVNDMVAAHAGPAQASPAASCAARARSASC